jgi:tRNA nucleotidyltransferase (CCA-adding enzyme)
MTPRLNPPKTVVSLAARLEDAGFETWCVGGAVRDALLGNKHLDWDFATSATPAEVQKLFKRTIPVGIEFGTVGVFDSDNVMHEVTTFRRDVRTDGRHAVVEFGASLDEDLARRDFTINAIAYSPRLKEVRDPFGGQKDIEEKMIRAVGDPRDRMREDRLRALRAIRFAARFRFQIDAKTWDAIVESAPHLGRLSGERVKQEIEKTMDQVALPSRAFAMWAKSGAFDTLIPPLAMVTDQQLAPLDHLRRPLISGRPHRKSTRIAALFAAAPPQTVRPALKALRFSNAETEWIGSLIDRWDRLKSDINTAMAAYKPPTDEVLRRWAAEAGRTRLGPLLRIANAHWLAAVEVAEPAPDPARIASVYRRAIRIAYNDPIEVADLAIDGDDLQKLGITGPAVGATLRKLLEVVINQPKKNTHDELLAIVRKGQPG